MLSRGVGLRTGESPGIAGVDAFAAFSCAFVSLPLDSSGNAAAA